jgi:hypothetical protein
MMGDENNLPNAPAMGVYFSKEQASAFFQGEQAQQQPAPGMQGLW